MVKRGFKIYFRIKYNNYKNIKISMTKKKMNQVNQIKKFNS